MLATELRGRVADQAADARAETASVVLIDDEEDLLFVLRRLLTRAGFDVVGEAKDGREGIELVRAVQPDVAVLDLAMPRMDGETALPELFSAAPRTMVAVLSAQLDHGRAERVLGRGAFAAYAKGDLSRLPGSLEADLERFRRVLGGEDAPPAWQQRYRQL